MLGRMLDPFCTHIDTSLLPEPSHTHIDMSLVPEPDVLVALDGVLDILPVIHRRRASGLRAPAGHLALAHGTGALAGISSLGGVLRGLGSLALGLLLLLVPSGGQGEDPSGLVSAHVHHIDVGLRVVDKWTGIGKSGLRT